MNNALTSENIRETLADMTDPESGRLLSYLGQIGDATVNEKKMLLSQHILQFSGDKRRDVLKSGSERLSQISRIYK